MRILFLKTGVLNNLERFFKFDTNLDSFGPIEVCASTWPVANTSELSCT